MKPPSQKHHPAKAAVTQFLCPEALDWLLSQMSAAALCNAVKSYPSWCSQLCRGGFKLTPQNLSSPAMHERLRQLMLRNPAYAEELLKLIRQQEGPWDVCLEMIELLGATWVLSSWRDLFDTLFDPRPFVLAMSFPDLYDPDLPRLAHRLLRCPSLWREKTLHDPLCDLWLDFAEAVLPPAKTPPANHPAAPPPADAAAATNGEAAQLAKLKTQNQELKNQNHKLAEDLNRERDRNHQLDHQYREQRHLREKDAKAAEQERQAVISRHQLELAQRDLDFQDRLEQEKQAFKLHFLGLTPQRQEQANQLRREDGSLLERLETAIAEQQQLNEQHGIRSLLLAEQERLQNALQRANALIEDAVTVSDGLLALMPDLEKRLQAISKQLKVSRPAHQPSLGLPMLLTGVIKSGNPAELADDDITRLQDFISQASHLNLISEADAVGLRHTLATRAQQKHLLQQPPPAWPNHRGPQEVWNFIPFLAEMPHMTIVIDGYNAIKCSKHWAAIEQKHSLNDARHDFLTACQRKKSYFHEWMIVFDGNDPVQTTREETLPGMTVVFAAKKHDEHNADDFIVEYLKQRPEASNPIWLVTGDQGIRRQAEPYCRAFVAAPALEKFLQPAP